MLGAGHLWNSNTAGIQENMWQAYSTNQSLTITTPHIRTMSVKREQQHSSENDIQARLISPPPVVRLHPLLPISRWPSLVESGASESLDGSLLRHAPLPVGADRLGIAGSNPVRESISLSHRIPVPLWAISDRSSACRAVPPGMRVSISRQSKDCLKNETGEKTPGVSQPGHWVRPLTRPFYFPVGSLVAVGRPTRRLKRGQNPCRNPLSPIPRVLSGLCLRPTKMGSG